jgi:hypothetical protein
MGLVASVSWVRPSDARCLEDTSSSYTQNTRLLHVNHDDWDGAGVGVLTSSRNHSAEQVLSEQR